MFIEYLPHVNIKPNYLYGTYSLHRETQRKKTKQILNGVQLR